MESYFLEGANLLSVEIESLKSMKKCSALCHTPAFQNIYLQVLEVEQRLMRNTRALNFHTNFSVSCLSGSLLKKHRIDIGALIELDRSGVYALNSYHVCITSDQGKRIIRKLHFDFEPASKRNQNEGKPSLHFQVCGELPPAMEIDGYQSSDIDHLDPKFEKPRIPCLPVSLAILLHIIFLEFKDSDENIRGIIKDTAWNALVRKAEREIYGYYFKGCQSFFAEHRNANSSFISKHLYALA